MRTWKPGQSRFFVGYKKHTLRLWISGFEPFILMLPLVSWAAPANVAEGYFLWPSVHYCRQRLHWSADIVVGDMAYINHSTQRALRQQQLAVVTQLRASMKAYGNYADDQPRCCPQGQALSWLGYDPQDEQHWFEPLSAAPLCSWCWERSHCPRQFAVPAATHETFFGMIPLNTAPARRLNHCVRSWIEPTQSFDKNQLGLKRMFLNSLRLCWITCLSVDSVALLREAVKLLQPCIELDHEQNQDENTSEYDSAANIDERRVWHKTYLSPTYLA